MGRPVPSTCRTNVWPGTVLPPPRRRIGWTGWRGALPNAPPWPSSREDPGGSITSRKIHVLTYGRARSLPRAPTEDGTRSNGIGDANATRGKVQEVSSWPRLWDRCGSNRGSETTSTREAQPMPPLFVRSKPAETVAASIATHPRSRGRRFARPAPGNARPCRSNLRNSNLCSLVRSHPSSSSTKGDWLFRIFKRWLPASQDRNPRNTCSDPSEGNRPPALCAPGGRPGPKPQQGCSPGATSQLVRRETYGSMPCCPRTEEGLPSFASASPDGGDSTQEIDLKTGVDLQVANVGYLHEWDVESRAEFASQPFGVVAMALQAPPGGRAKQMYDSLAT